jgi:hypothetical protein
MELLSVDGINITRSTSNDYEEIVLMAAASISLLMTELDMTIEEVIDAITSDDFLNFQKSLKPIQNESDTTH